MRSFYRRLLLFLLPLFPVVGTPVLLMLRGGELLPVRRVVRRQMAGKALFGTAYSGRERPYKLWSILDRRPAVLTLGTSRVMQFRSGFFRHPAGFYNCGVGTLNLWHVLQVLQRVPAVALPKVLILGLDPWWFNPYVTDTRAQVFSYNSAQISFAEPEFAEVLADWWKVYRDLVERKVRAGEVLRCAARSDIGEPIGVWAIMKGSGFRSDGSIRYGELMGAHPLTHRTITRQMLARLEQGETWFAHSQSISPDSLAEMRRLLEWCKARGIHVIGYLPPYPPSVYRKMHAIPGLRYVWDLPGKLKPIFQEAGARFFDALDATRFGARDEEFLDESHGSEVCYLRLLRLMSREDPVLRSYVDDGRLGRLLDHRLTRFDLGLDLAPEGATLAQAGRRVDETVRLQHP